MSVEQEELPKFPAGEDQANPMKFIRHRTDAGIMPSDEDLKAETLRMKSGSNPAAEVPNAERSPWFRGNALTSDDSGWPTQIGHDAVSVPSECTSSVASFSKDQASFDVQTYLEVNLMNFLKDQATMGIVPTDSQLQEEGCHIISNLHSPRLTTSEAALSYYHHLITSSTEWVTKFRVRAGVHTSRTPLSNGSWNQTLAAHSEWPTNMKASQGSTGVGMNNIPAISPGQSVPLSQVDGDWDMNTFAFDNSSLDATTQQVSLSSTIFNPNIMATASTTPNEAPKSFLNDASCYKRLEQELDRYVKSCLSPHNPNAHKPDDAELQHQARWIIYNDGDPWNQTAADNAEWLLRFKCSHGLVHRSDGPGLPNEDGIWDIQTGSGFTPPYMQASARSLSTVYNNMSIPLDLNRASMMPLCPEILNDAPATVFCSRELEQGLFEYVRQCLRQGFSPTDMQLRTKAREILGTESTAADNMQLLVKFKNLCGIGSESIPVGEDFSGGVRKFSPGVTMGMASPPGMHGSQL
jgi:hypothetical protein